MELMLARSKAGHDKDHVYVVKEMTEEYVFLVNGTTKTWDAPKKKKRKHIQPIKHLSSELKAFAANGDWNDAAINHILDLYHRRKENV